MSILYRLSLPRVLNRSKELRLCQAFVNLFKADTKGYHYPGIFDDLDDPKESSRGVQGDNVHPGYNRRGGYIEEDDQRQRPRFSHQKRGSYNTDFSKRNRNYRFDQDEDSYNVNYNKRNRNYKFDKDDDSDYEIQKPQQTLRSDGFHRTPRYPSSFGQSFDRNLKKPSFDLENLSPVEKNFYVEHQDVADRSMVDVESYRQLHSISIRGPDVPKPISKFSELCLPEKVQSVIENQGYMDPTPIQAQGWPIALSGKDMIGISQTGSGKTLVFMLPAVIHASNQAKDNAGESRQFDCKPQVLVLGPTRELVQQIQQVSHKFVRACGMNSSCAFGGASKDAQLRFLRGSEICIATPGRLIDFISEGSVSLERCTYLVLDEADRMLDMGFEPQIRQIVDQTRQDRQTLMWSATWPTDIQNLAEDFLTDYVQVTIGSGELVANPNIQQNIYVTHDSEKHNSFVSLLSKITGEEGNKVLVFAATKRMVDQLNYQLNGYGIRSMGIHGDISQSKRDHVLRSFRSQKSGVLIATDVAARGLDVTDITHVVNFDFPTNVEDYIHRIGRTARGTGHGVAHSFFTSTNAGVAKDLIKLLRQSNQEVDPQLQSMVNWGRNNTQRRSRFPPRRMNLEM